jgi:hypothetical protein
MTFVCDKACSCGARFELQVELVVHCKKTGHVAVGQRPPRRTVAAAPARLTQPEPRSFKRGLATGIALLSLTAFMIGSNLAVSSFTSWQNTSQVLVLP